ncbi:MAG: cation-translocating P-type ATPase [Ignavibacteria bacterium]|nr:cation-translocating P-type ATPase [Ignavibacteria bacterium]
MTGNSGEIWTMFLAPFFGLPVPLLPIHILWVNLVTDGLPGLALASEPAEKEIMKRKPRNPKDNIFSDGMAFHIIWVDCLLDFCASEHWLHTYGRKNTHWQTMAFTVLCFVR